MTLCVKYLVLKSVLLPANPELKTTVGEDVPGSGGAEGGGGGGKGGAGRVSAAGPGRGGGGGGGGGGGAGTGGVAGPFCTGKRKETNGLLKQRNGFSCNMPCVHKVTENKTRKWVSKG